jgi:hypothetical protein
MLHFPFIPGSATSCDKGVPGLKDYCQQRGVHWQQFNMVAGRSTWVRVFLCNGALVLGGGLGLVTLAAISPFPGGPMGAHVQGRVLTPWIKSRRSGYNTIFHVLCTQPLVCCPDARAPGWAGCGCPSTETEGPASDHNLPLQGASHSGALRQCGDGNRYVARVSISLLAPVLCCWRSHHSG